MVKVATYLEKIEAAANNRKKVDGILVRAAREAYAEKSQYWAFITLYSENGRYYFLGPGFNIIDIEDYPQVKEHEKPVSEITIETLESFVANVKLPEAFLKNLDRGISPIGAAGKTGLKARDLEDIFIGLEEGKIKVGYKTTLKRRC